MKTYKTLNLLFVAGFAVLLTSSVAGQDALGADTSSLGADQAASAGTGTAGTADPAGGTIQGLNLTSEATAEDWAGLYGQIETSRVLSDGSNTFYEWQASEPDNMEFVYATLDDTTPSSSNVEAANDVDSLTGISAGAEAASNTFNESGTFSGLGATISGADIAETQSTSGTLNTYLLNGTSTNAPVYAAEAGNLNAFDGDSVNYQMILGGGQGPYDFYVEL